MLLLKVFRAKNIRTTIAVNSAEAERGFSKMNIIRQRGRLFLIYQTH